MRRVAARDRSENYCHEKKKEKKNLLSCGRGKEKLLLDAPPPLTVELLKIEK